MSLIATLIANPEKQALSPNHAKMACEFVEGSEIIWLADNIACDIVLPADVENAQEKLRQVLLDLPFDIIVQKAENRRKKLFIADMDSTMIQQECIDEMAQIAGVGDEVRKVTARAMAGKLDFEDAFRQRLALLEGLPVAKMVEIIREVITLTPGACELVQTMKANGATCELVSGGFTQFTAYVARQCGFDDHQANQLEIDKGHLTGKAVEPILGPKAKLRAITHAIMSNNLTFSESMAVGDGANDIPMIRRAGMGVAFRANPVVQEVANANIDHGDLTALLYIQGYKQSEFVSDL